MDTKFIPMTQLGVPSSLSVDDLLNVSHPVNNKSLFGKREGMCVMVAGSLYVASGSSPSDAWSKLPYGQASKSPIYSLKGNTSPTDVVNDITSFTPVKAIKLTEVASEYKDGITVSPNTYSFTVDKDGDFKIEITGIAVTREGAASIGAHLYFHLLVTDTSEILSGSEHVGTFGISFGNDATLSFFSIGYGRFTKGQTVQLKVAADFSGQVFIDDSVLSLTAL